MKYHLCRFYGGAQTAGMGAAGSQWHRTSLAQMAVEWPVGVPLLMSLDSGNPAIGIFRESLLDPDRGRSKKRPC